MENAAVLILVLVAGFFAGLTVSWFFHRTRVAAAIVKGGADAQIEIATSRERLRAAENELQILQAEHTQVKQQLTRLNSEVNMSQSEIATLTERTNRIPSLEAALAQANEAERNLQHSVLELSTSEAEKSQLLESTRNKLAEIETDQAEMQRLLETRTRALNEINEQYAALEVKASRTATLEQDLADKEARYGLIYREVATLKEDNGRLQAELKAEQDRVMTLTTSHDSLQMQLKEKDITLSTLNKELGSVREISGRLQAEVKASNDSVTAIEAREENLQKKLVNAENALHTCRHESSIHEATISRLEAELGAETQALAAMRADLSQEKVSAEAARATVQKLTASLSEVNAHLETERSQHNEKLALLTQAREQLSLEFKNLASEILGANSKRFNEDANENLGQLLNPLKERMSEFKTKVEEIHAKDIEQQAMLRSELNHLKDLNRQMTEEAHGLATALKGQAKTQGNWGELVLGNILDRSGLCEGKDFRREVSFNTDEGRKRPDVIVSMPQKKHLVIDAKVSLNAYIRYVNADDELTRAQALKEHVSAISSRIQELSDRKYFELPGLNTPEMVFMFIPIESAFVEALRADEGLFLNAVSNNILVATPTTLLTSLNIVRQLWRFEEQNLHTAELADKAAKVYKKLVSFLTSMEAVGAQLDKAKDSYNKALGQLVHGRGNLIQQASDFERLGVSIQTSIPEHLVTKAMLELDPSAVAENMLTLPGSSSMGSIADV